MSIFLITPVTIEAGERSLFKLMPTFYLSFYIAKFPENSFINNESGSCRPIQRTGDIVAMLKYKCQKKSSKECFS